MTDRTEKVLAALESQWMGAAVQMAVTEILLLQAENKRLRNERDDLLAREYDRQQWVPE